MDTRRRDDDGIEVEFEAIVCCGRKTRHLNQQPSESREITSGTAPVARKQAADPGSTDQLECRGLLERCELARHIMHELHQHATGAEQDDRSKLRIVPSAD